MKYIIRILFLLLCLCGCAEREQAEEEAAVLPDNSDYFSIVLQQYISERDDWARMAAVEPESLYAQNQLPELSYIKEKYEGQAPTQWGDHLEGIISRVNTGENIIALTFDACGYGKGAGYDKELIDYLIEEKINATLFISGKWIEENPDLLPFLSKQQNFEIENHGYRHKPLSVSGRSQYGIEGTKSVEEVYNEIAENSMTIYSITGHMPMFFRTGTAFYDEVAIAIAKELGQEIGGYTIAADGGATFGKDQIVAACQNAEAGDILLFHMNRPDSGTNEGVRTLVPLLRDKGFRFVKLDECIN